MILAKDQPEYEPLPALVATNPGVVLTRWRPDEDQRDMISDDEDIFLQVLTFGQPLQPVMLTVGLPETTFRYDNTKDIFDATVGTIVRAWAKAINSISKLDPNYREIRHNCTQVLLNGLTESLLQYYATPTGKIQTP